MGVGNHVQAGEAVTDAKTAKLRALEKLCRTVLAIEADGRSGRDAKLAGARRMAEKVLGIIMEKSKP